jgi:hypothetical protein
MSRLKAYGVRPERMVFTGFPLPHELVGGPQREIARRNLAARLVRLDPSRAFVGPLERELELSLGPLPADERGRPPRITFAIGGAGAQVELAAEFLPSLARLIREQRLTITLVAGRRKEVAEALTQAVEAAGLGSSLGGAIEILVEDDWPRYYRAFSELLSRSDALWTKPSEMVFYGGLGLPLILSAPVGVHEIYNRRWAMEAGAGLEQHEVAHAGGWIAEWLEDGTLAGAAWCGFSRLPTTGLYRILDAVGATVL